MDERNDAMDGDNKLDGYEMVLIGLVLHEVLIMKHPLFTKQFDFDELSDIARRFKKLAIEQYARDNPSLKIYKDTTS